MTANELLKLIPESKLDFLSAKTNVDHQVKKLNGSTMFRLILFSMLESNKASLRVMEHFYHSATFKVLTNLENSTTKFNSIRDRITTINADYFEAIFHYAFNQFSDLLAERGAIMRFDSTMVAISSQLVDWGMKVGNKTNKKQIKFTIGMKGSLPCHVNIYTDQKALSEDKTIPPTIINFEGKNDGVLVFDRGVSSRKSFQLFSNENLLFVTRVNTNTVFRLIESKKIRSKKANELIIKQDLIVELKDRDNVWTSSQFRLIKTMLPDKNEIYFLTNITDLPPEEIATIYKRRWDIEVFFKFLKQELNLTHLVSRTKNGIKVMIFMTLILAILILAYKKKNKLSGYKIPKIKFVQELEAAIIKEIVILCGGQPSKMSHLFNDT